MAQPHAERRPRSNTSVALMALAAILFVAFIPAMCRSVVEPDRRYPTAAAARASADAGEWVPSFLPASARGIHERHGEGRRFLAFVMDSAEVGTMTAGLQRLDSVAVKEVPVPTPGWSSWWPISPRTLQGGQAKQLSVFRVNDPRDRGYLAVDPRTFHAFYWATAR
ncbi:MAG TPA: hypothetical protein VE913_08775 [Longimicrobium sp.]|nr:hypothetical protein [Longimicrobium sp.]